MKPNLTFRRVSIVAVVAGIALAGCANTPPTNFYMLRPTASLDPAGAHARSENDLSVVIGPVKVPDYLERPQIVTRSDNSGLFINEFHQWAEPLESNIERVLAENLSVLLATERIVHFPPRKLLRVDYQVIVDVIRFDADENGETELIARWRVLKGDGEEAVLQKRSSYVRTAAELTYGAIAAAMSDNLGELSSDIAAAITTGR